jgi:hypothetical protein
MAIYRDPLASTTGPRSLVRRPEAPGLLRWVPRVFIVPHFLVGVGILLASLTLVATALVGTRATGHVIGERVTIGSKKNGNSYVVEYAYPTPSGEAMGSETVSIGSLSQPTAADRKVVGQSIEVRHLGAGNYRVSVPASTSAGAPAVMLGFALFWNTFVGLFVWMLWVAPLRQRWLYRHGVPAPGTVVSKRTRQGKAVSHEVSYSFELPGGTVKQGTVQGVPKKIWETLQVGDRVTVLHPRDRATPSLVYECGDYAWADETPAR